MSDFLNDWICFEIRLDRKREEPDLGIGEVDELCDCVLFHCREYVDYCLYDDDDECCEEYYDDCEEEIFCTD